MVCSWKIQYMTRLISLCINKMCSMYHTVRSFFHSVVAILVGIFWMSNLLEQLILRQDIKATWLCLAQHNYTYLYKNKSIPTGGPVSGHHFTWRCAGNAGNVSPPPRVSISDMHHGTCVMHIPGICGACATRNFTYLVRGPFQNGSGPSAGRIGFPDIRKIDSKWSTISRDISHTSIGHWGMW